MLNKVIRHKPFYTIIFFFIISMLFGRSVVYAQTFLEESVTSAYDGCDKVELGEHESGERCDMDMVDMIIGLLQDISDNMVSSNRYRGDVLERLEMICEAVSGNKVVSINDADESCNVGRSISDDEVISISGQDLLEIKDLLKTISEGQCTGRSVDYVNGVVLAMMLGCMVAFVITRYMPWKH